MEVICPERLEATNKLPSLSPFHLLDREGTVHTYTHSCAPYFVFFFFSLFLLPLSNHGHANLGFRLKTDSFPTSRSSRATSLATVRAGARSSCPSRSTS